MSLSNFKSNFERNNALTRMEALKDRYLQRYGGNPIKDLKVYGYFKSIGQRINALSISRKVLDEELSEKNFKTVAKMSRILALDKTDRKAKKNRMPYYIRKVYSNLIKEIEDYQVSRMESIAKHLQSLDDKISEDILDGKPRESIDSQISDFMLLANYGLPKNNYEGRALSLEFRNRLNIYDELFHVGTDAEGLYDMMEGNDGESTRN